jgi:hypothetical protein
MLNPNSLTCSIASRVTWDPCPSKMSRCLFVRDISFGIIPFEKRQKLLEK